MQIKPLYRGLQPKQISHCTALDGANGTLLLNDRLGSATTDKTTMGTDLSPLSLVMTGSPSAANNTAVVQYPFDFIPRFWMRAFS
jgi:hypothetical protein